MEDALAKRTPKENQAARDFFGIQARNLAKLNAEGVKIGFGTDSSTEVGWTVHTELADMVTAGMTPAQVIRAATQTAAEIVKLDQLGEVAPGKSADFIVLDANPLDNITNTRRISRVYLRGKEIDRAALRASLSANPEPAK
jgi:imidazolonepropionase-like amidohydrolase